MERKDIDKMFENRWRMKGDSTLTMMHETLDGKLSLQELSVRIASLCRDFFEAGILLGEGFRKDEITFHDGQKGTVVYKRELDMDTLDGGFSIFWELYEKKVGRPKCEKLWSKLTVKEREECIAYIPFYKQAQQDKQYRKNPETFLRNKCWNDELIYHNNGEPAKQFQTDKLADILVG